MQLESSSLLQHTIGAVRQVLCNEHVSILGKGCTKTAAVPRCNMQDEQQQVTCTCQPCKQASRETCSMQHDIFKSIQIGNKQHNNGTPTHPHVSTRLSTGLSLHVSSKSTAHATVHAQQQYAQHSISFVAHSCRQPWVGTDSTKHVVHKHTHPMLLDNNTSTHKGIDTCTRLVGGVKRIQESPSAPRTRRLWTNSLVHCCRRASTVADAETHQDLSAACNHDCATPINHADGMQHQHSFAPQHDAMWPMAVF